MANVIFSTANSGHTYKNPDGVSVKGNALIGRYETPIKAVIMHESDVAAKNDDLVKSLFEVSSSNKFGESFVLQNDFDLFTPTAEGAAAPSVSYNEVASKFIRHTTFKSHFRITREMMEDSLINQIAAKAEKFTRSYFRTRNLFASTLLTGATGGSTGKATTVQFGPEGAKRDFDITTADGKPLFSATHKIAPNREHLVLSGKIDTVTLENVISAAVEKIRNMKDENGYPMGYTADTIVIPCNDRALEVALKKVLGSEFSNAEDGSLSGSVNLHYGNWKLVVNPLWQRTVKTSHPMMFLSSKARRNLRAAMFFDRKPLDVTESIDELSLDYIWTGYARMSGGFVSHKWCCLIDLLDSGSKTLFDGSGTDTNGGAGVESAPLTL